MSELRFADLKRVYWPATAKVAVARGFASGVVFAILNLALQPPSAGGVGSLLMLPFGMAMLAIPMGLFCHLAGKIAGAFTPLMGAFFSIIGSLIVCLGDPIVYFLNRQFPQLLDVTDFGFFNFTPILMVMRPE